MTRTSLRQKKHYRTICVIISGLIGILSKEEVKGRSWFMCPCWCSLGLLLALSQWPVVLRLTQNCYEGHAAEGSRGNKRWFVPRAQHINFGRSHPPRKNNPKMPVRDPQNEFPGIPWIGLSPGISILFNKETLDFPEFPAFPWRGFLGEDGVDLLGSSEWFVKGQHCGMRPRSGFWYRSSVCYTLVLVFGIVVPFVLYPRFGLWGARTSAKTRFWKPPFCRPPKQILRELFLSHARTTLRISYANSMANLQW